MDRKTPQTLAEIFLSSLDQSEVKELISKAIRTPGMVGQTLHESLVMSGAALGAERVSKSVMGIMNSHVVILRDILTSLDARMVMAQGNDEMLEFITSIRAPLVAKVENQRRLFRADTARLVSDRTGISLELLLSDEPIDDMDPDTLAEAGTSAALQTGPSFMGFLVSKNPAKLKCGCGVCLLDELILYEGEESQYRLAVKKFGSMHAAFIAYAKHFIQDSRNRVARLSSAVAPDHGTSREDAANATEEILSRLFRPDGDESAGREAH